MTDLHTAARMALEALEELQQTFERFYYGQRLKAGDSATAAIREALEQPQCDRCGKPLGADGHIHTCTPKRTEQPQPDPFADLSDADLMAMQPSAVEQPRRHISYVCPQCDASMVPEEQQEQEPVALETVYETIVQWDEGGGKRSRRELARRIVALYTAPQRREWVGLTTPEIFEIRKAKEMNPLDFARAIEARLKERNA